MRSGRRTRKKDKEEYPDKSRTPSNLEEMTRAELTGTEPSRPTLNLSSTDEDEDEGLGDGNIGLSKDDIPGKD